MAKQNINVGTAANDKKGDSLRAAFVKVNSNFTELYTALGINADVNLNLGAFEFTGSVMSTTDSTAIVIDQATTVTSNLSVGGDIVPQTANGGDLGSSTLPWRSLYVSNNTIFIGGVALGVDSQGNLLVGGQSIADVGTAAWNSITGKPTFATVATSGAYADLTDKPTLFDGAYSSLSGQPALFSGSYADLTNKPNLAGTYQFSVAADDSTQRVISTDEVIKFIGAGGITTASDAEGNITITGSGGSLGNIFAVYNNTLVSSDSAAFIDFAGGMSVNQLALGTNDGSLVVITTDGGYSTFEFVADSGTGSIKFPDGTIQTTAWTGIANALRSETGIYIDVNLSDSTLRRWQFGEDGILTLPSVGKISNGAYDWTFGSTGITTFPGVINAGNINNLVVNDLGGGTSLTAGSQLQIGNSAGIAGAGVIIKNAVTNTLGGETELESGSKIQMDNGNVSLFGYTVNNGLGGGVSLENQLVVEVDNSNLNKVVRIGTRIITTIEGSTTNVFQGVTISQYGELTFPDNTVQSTAWTGFSVAADDSTQRLINAGEVVKFVGAGGITTASDAEGNITINYVQGDIRSEGDINIDINLADSTLRRWSFGEDGDTVFPNNVSINYGGGNNVLYPRIIADSGKLFSVQGQGSTGSAALAWSVDPNADTKYAAVGVNQGGGDNLAKVVLTAGNTTATLKVWKLDETGNLTLPQGGVISEGGGISGAIKLTPSGGANVYQALLIYPTGNAEGDHIHLTAAGGTTELYLGSDNHYVKLASGGVVRIQADNGVNSSAAWTFDTAGNIDAQQALGIKVPNGVPSSITDIGMTTGYWELNPLSNLATTGGSGSGLTVTVTETGGYASAIAIATAGTGYTAGDYITVTSGTSSAAFIIAVAGRNTWLFGEDGSLTFPDNTVQTTAPESFSFSVAADDSTQRAISNNELVKFIGAGGVTTASDAEGNITITGSGGGSSIPAVVTTGAAGVNGSAHCKVQFTVASATTVTAVGVTAIGVTDSTKGTITLSGSPGTGAFDIVAVTNTTPGEYYILMPFATNASGTGYGAPISGEGTNPCLVRGTLITMADMSRVAVENITYSDNILVWDFDLGEFASAKPVWIKKTQTTVVSCLLTFSDHSELQIVGDSPKAHRIFNKEAGKFTYGSMPETPIGTTTFNDQGEEITLISKEWIVGEVEFYNVMTDYHMNLFANSILTSMRYNNLYPITDMKFVKDSRTLRTADDYPNVEERLYKGFRLAEQTQSVEEIETHIQWLLTLEVERETECV